MAQNNTTTQTPSPAPAPAQQSTEPSSINATVTYAKGVVQETIGNLTSAQDWKQAGLANRQAANDELARVEESKPKTETAEPSRLNGNLNALVGGVRETIGSAIGSSSMVETGTQQRRQGNDEYEAAKAEEYLKGAGKAAHGTVQGVVEGLIGDEEGKHRGDLKKEEGKHQMDLNQL